MTMPTELKIMLCLFEAGKLNYRGISNEGISPRIVRRRLDNLMRKGFVHEEAENWKQGKQKLYSLTVKGREHFLELSTEYFNEVFRSIQSVTSEIVSKPDKLKQLRQFLRKNPPLPVTPEVRQRGYFTKEEDERFQEHREYIHGPLIESFKLMFKIYLEVWGMRKPNGELMNVVLGITKEGGVYEIPVNLLKRRGMGIGL